MRFCNDGVTCFLMILLVAAGCGGGGGNASLAPVTGQVIYKEQPVEGAQVTFVCATAARPATGVTDKEGRFQLTTFEFKDGATIGPNVITVTKADPKAEAAVVASPQEDDETRKDPTKLAMMPGKNRDIMKAKADKESKNPKGLLPAKYGNPKSTTLKEEVTKAGPNKFVLQLTD